MPSAMITISDVSVPSEVLTLMCLSFLMMLWAATPVLISTLCFIMSLTWYSSNFFRSITYPGVSIVILPPAGDTISIPAISRMTYSGWMISLVRSNIPSKNVFAGCGGSPIPAFRSSRITSISCSAEAIAALIPAGLAPIIITSASVSISKTIPVCVFFYQIAKL